MAAVFLRRLSAALALVVASVLLVAGPATADPEDGPKSLRDALESAAKGQAEAIQKLDASKKRQKQMRVTVRQSRAAATALGGQVGEIANRSYRLGRANALTMLLESSSPDLFLDRIQQLDMLAQLDGQVLRRYREDLERATAAEAAVVREIKEQQKQVTALTKKKKEAELALGSVGGGGPAGGFLSVNSPLAKAAPRNSDGSWPRESCTVNDPTSSGCITPRTLHAFQESRSDGFRRYTVCYSRRSSGEHPKGRACDLSANASTFRNVTATGGDRRYGDRLAAYLVKNSSRLGVMYVIWYRQIWMPGTGWKRYSASGGPAAVHTNHVHVSML